MNYYEILEINQEASQEVIKAAYKALAKKYHPDCYKGNIDNAAKSMVLINEAFEVLSDEKKRAEYDRKISFENNRKTSNGNYTESSNFYYHNNENVTSEKRTDSNRKSNDRCNRNPIIQFFYNAGKRINDVLQENAREIENAYFAGIEMGEYELVRKFRSARGNERLGYAKALEERGFLEKNSEGRYVPTYKFKRYF